MRVARTNTETNATSRKMGKRQERRREGLDKSNLSSVLALRQSLRSDFVRRRREDTDFEAGKVEEFRDHGSGVSEETMCA